MNFNRLKGQRFQEESLYSAGHGKIYKPLSCTLTDSVLCFREIQVWEHMISWHMKRRVRVHDHSCSEMMNGIYF